MTEVEDFEKLLKWLLKRDDVIAYGPKHGSLLVEESQRLEKQAKLAPYPVNKQLEHFARCALELSVYEAGAQKCVLLQLQRALGKAGVD